MITDAMIEAAGRVLFRNTWQSPQENIVANEDSTHIKANRRTMIRAALEAAERAARQPNDQPHKGDTDA